MTLYTKCIFKPATLEDGLRISVMSRHTLNDGKTVDERITPETYHKWMPELAPEPRMVGKWHRKEIEWNTFEAKYFQRIRAPDIALLVEALALSALKTNITLLCAEETPQYCHRRLLGEECRIYTPKLIVVHK